MGTSSSWLRLRQALARHPQLVRLGALGVACVLVGVSTFVVGDLAGPTPTPPAGQVEPPGALASEMPASAAPASPVTTSPAPSPVPEAAWLELELPDVTPVATLGATQVGPAGVARTARFTLTSLGKTSASKLAKGITATPAVAFRIRPGPTSKTALLVPKAPLAAGVSYRFTLHTADGAAAGSWLFRTESPIQVASTLPGNQATDVPVDTGIEVTFDQDGIGPIAPFFSIEPSVAGAFELHARTWAFVPEQQFRPATIYTVTVKRGVTLAGSNQVLEQDVEVTFETAGPEKPSTETQAPLDATFPRTIVEVAPTDRPLIELYVDQPESEEEAGRPLTSVDLRVFRLPGLPAAIDAYRTLERAPDWARASDQELVRTSGLSLAASFTAQIHTTGSGWEAVSYIEFPGPLDPGWYLLVRPRTGRDQQMVLQVTDVATYVTTTTTRSVLWVNDVSSGGPLAGATLWTDGGTAIATTGVEGTATPEIPAGDLFIVTAPEAGAPGPETLAGRAAIVPLRVGSDEDGWDCWGDESNDDFWTILATDRRLFRPTDEVDAWGMVRPRDGRALPGDVELRLSTPRWDCGETAAENAALAVARVPLTPGGRTGSFAMPIPIRDLPPGSYQVELWAGNTRVASREIEVGEIRKPSYTLAVATDRHVLVEGDPFTVHITSTFFDGTPVPGLDLALHGTDIDGGDDLGRRTKTSAEGQAAISLIAVWPDRRRSGSDGRDISVAPVTPEESDIPDLSTRYVVLPARLVLDATAEVEGATLQVRGDAHLLDQARAEREWLAAAGADWNPDGPPAAGARVHIRVVDNWDVRVRTGRAYDFITKRAYDTYTYKHRERVIADADVKVAADGTLRLDVARTMGSVTAPKGHEYAVTISGRDRDGRAVEAAAWAYAPWSAEVSLPRDDEPLASLGWVEHSESRGFAIGTEMRLPLAWRGGQPPTGGANRYLFLTATRGLRSTLVSESPVFVHPFSAHDLPNAAIDAVWFTGDRYVAAGSAWVEFDRADREVAVTLTPDASRHAPGDTVRLSVRTADGSGRPVAATVVLRAVDEKLYAIDAAVEESPLDDLYAFVATGILTTYASHPLPSGDDSDGADTGGGGDGFGPVRVDFRDTVLFRRVTTNVNGRASVSFALADDITSWRISGAAITADLRVGQSSVSVAAGLPLFIEAPVAPDYLVSDRPTLLVRAYGTALASGQAVTYTVSAPTLGLAPTSVVGSAFTAAAVPLPPLRPGEHDVRIEARAGSGSAVVRDTLVRKLRVVESRFAQTRSTHIVLPAGLPEAIGTGMATYVFADEGRGRYLWPVQELAWGGGDRVDQALAALIARDVLRESFGIDEGASSEGTDSVERYQKSAPLEDGGTAGAGIALLPWGSPEVALSARVSLLAGMRFRTWDLEEFFSTIRTDPTKTREQKNLALAGLAGISDSVAKEVAAALGDPALTVRERLYLALAAAILGDHTTALAAERALLETYGQRFGPWVRLRVGSTENDVLEATSLVALIAVTVGDPIAEAAEAYVDEHFTREDLYDLQKAAFLRAAIERAPASAARFSYTLAGASRVVDLGPGETFSLALTPVQRATLSARTLRGRIGVTASWEEPVSPSSVARDPTLSLTRTITPGSPVPAGSIVKVTLTPRFGELTIGGCYRVVDLAPSGLLPLAWAWGGTQGSEDVTPSSIRGQRVVFCTGPWWSRPPQLVYYARVVSPGTYTWEPAIMQPKRAAESAALTPADSVVIRRGGSGLRRDIGP